MGDWSKDFSIGEFKCKCCGAFCRKDKLVEKLQEVRDKVKVPIIVNSGTRCNAHNREVGGVDTSDHLDGMAADIRCSDMWLLLRACLAVFPRVGIGPHMSYIHVDISEKKPQKRYWVYDNNGKHFS